MSKRRDFESPVHAEIVRYLRLVLPVSDGYLVHSSPNGARMEPKQCAKMKWMGMMPGWPDIEIVAPAGRFYGLEVKVPKAIAGRAGVLSDDQLAFKGHCDRYEIPYAIVRSVDDARAALAAWGIDTREASAA